MKNFLCLLLIFALLSVMLCACTPKEEPPTQTKVERGTTTDTTYTNESLDLQFTLPSGWRFYSDTELAQLMNITKELFQDTTLLDSANVTSVFEFMAIENSNGAKNINLTIENLKASGNADITVEKYIESFKTMIQQQVPDATYSFSDATAVTLGGQEYTKLEATCTLVGINMTQFLYLRKVGSYMICISATTTTGGESSVFEAMFS